MFRPSQSAEFERFRDEIQRRITQGREPARAPSAIDEFEKLALLQFANVANLKINPPGSPERLRAEAYSPPQIVPTSFGAFTRKEEGR
jgi:hypothetical protein